MPSLCFHFTKSYVISVYSPWGKSYNSYLNIPTSIFSLFSLFFPQFLFTVFLMSAIPRICILIEHWEMPKSTSKKKKLSYQRWWYSTLQQQQQQQKWEKYSCNFRWVCLLWWFAHFSCLQFSQIDAAIYSNYAIKWSIIYHNDDKMASYRNLSGIFSYFTCLLFISANKHLHDV